MLFRGSYLKEVQTGRLGATQPRGTKINRYKSKMQLQRSKLDSGTEDPSASCCRGNYSPATTKSWKLNRGANPATGGLSWWRALSGRPQPDEWS
jgi:hypothetical protein